MYMYMYMYIHIYIYICIDICISILELRKEQRGPCSGLSMDSFSVSLRIQDVHGQSLLCATGKEGIHNVLWS